MFNINILSKQKKNNINLNNIIFSKIDYII